MNGLRNRQTSKTSGFLRNAISPLALIIPILGLLSVVSYGIDQTYAQSDTITAERMDAHTVLFTYEGKQYMGFDLEASKKLKQAENDAASFSQQLNLCKANVQDERVKYSKLETLYGEQKVILESCMKLSKNGGVLKNPWLQLGVDLAPTVTTLVRPCRH